MTPVARAVDALLEASVIGSFSRIGLAARSRLLPEFAGPPARLDGRAVVITGATSGIGAVAAEQLARLGARIVFIARDPRRGADTLKHLQSITPGAAHALHHADLSQLAEMKRVAGIIAERESRIDVLINNAGAMFTRRELSADGFEMTFATNHLAYFVVTHLLRGRLEATAGARIVCTASDAHRGARLDFADLQSERSYSGFAQYGRSKLMNILFTRELARRLAGTGVTANALHPGFVATRFGEGAGGLMSVGLRVAKKFALTPEQGAQTIIYLASSPEVAAVSGAYFHECKPTPPTPQAQSDADARRLWELSARLAGIGG
jgi:NAD(P)-dependent dehydrogenase (short-subunit alcohol dehydrogenase family)